VIPAGWESDAVWAHNSSGYWHDELHVGWSGWVAVGVYRTFAPPPDVCLPARISAPSQLWAAVGVHNTENR